MNWEAISAIAEVVGNAQHRIQSLPVTYQSALPLPGNRHLTVADRYHIVRTQLRSVLRLHSKRSTQNQQQRAFANHARYFDRFEQQIHAWSQSAQRNIRPVLQPTQR